MALDFFTGHFYTDKFFRSVGVNIAALGKAWNPLGPRIGSNLLKGCLLPFVQHMTFLSRLLAKVADVQVVVQLKFLSHWIYCMCSEFSWTNNNYYICQLSLSFIVYSFDAMNYSHPPRFCYDRLIQQVWNIPTIISKSKMFSFIIKELLPITGFQ